MINIKTNYAIRNLLILSIIGNLLYFLFPFPAIVWRLTFVILSLYCAIKKYFSTGFTFFEKSIFFFIALNLIYYFISTLWKNPPTTTIGNILCALSGFIAFPYLAEKGVLNRSFLEKFSIIILIVALPYYYHAKSLALAHLSINNTETTINASSIFLLFLPGLISFQNKRNSILLFCVCLFYILSGVKRGVIIAAIIPSILFLYTLWKDSKQSFIKRMGIITVIIIIFITAKHLIVNNTYFISRFESTLEGNTSGRDVIYSFMWSLWANAESLINMFFGFGFLETIPLSPMHKMAHNDWLEILVDYGILGIISYLMIFISIILEYTKLHNSELKIVLISIISIWILETSYSMAFLNEQLAILSITFAYITQKNREVHI